MEFPDGIQASKVPSSSEAFFTDFLQISVNDEFRRIPRKEKKEEFLHEHFDQYYKGIKVDDAGYNFHYKNGKMFYAHGHYVKVNDLNATPTVTPEKAKDCFAIYKSIPLDSIADFIAELVIKEVPVKESDSVFLPKLAYRVYIYADYDNNIEIGFVDAHTCEVLLTEPVLAGYSATGTFDTRYSGSRQGITQNYSGAFHLADSTRGAIIHTWNLNGSTSILDRIELSDNNNNWTSAEHSASENDMGLDVHWALQQIYDRLNNIHGINSFDDNGFAIDAHIHYGTSNNDRDNAFWNLVDNVLLFGDGAVAFRPVASIDAVAHEFGHGISDLQMGWPYTGDRAAFHEGMSDIWAAILEQRIRPSSTWRIGEQVTIDKPYLRNIENTNDLNAKMPISDTYLSAQYNSGDNYVRSGVLSHWFYLLVNGGSGTNGIGNTYTVYGMSMDIAENLIIEAVFNGYLNNVTSYPTIRTSMVNAATALCGANSLLVWQVENAWYAVGVGTQPAQVTFSGPSFVCSSGASFTINNPPPGITIEWTKGPYLTRTSAQGSNPCTFSSIGSGSSWVRATLVTDFGSVPLPQKAVWAGTPTSPTAIALLPDDGVCRGPAYYYQVGLLHPYPSYVSSWYWDLQPPGVIIGSRTGSSLKFYYPAGTTPGRYSVGVKAVNPCGDSSYHIEYFDVIDCDRQEIVSFNIYPNPVRDVLNIEITANDAVEINPEAITELRIYDTYLSLKKQLTFSGSTVSVNTGDLPQGVYLIQFVTEEDFLWHTDTMDAKQAEALKQRVFWSKFEKIP